MLIKHATASGTLSCVTPEVALSSEANMQRFRSLTAEIKRVAPRSDEFVYFVCRAIHAMEAANFDPVTKAWTGDGYIVRRGENGQDQHGNPVEEWENGLWRSAKGIKPYVNQNGDAFPEEELLKEVTIEAKDGTKKTIKAYETFIGRGLFVNHASDDAEKIRGIILDASWDPDTKGVDILVACDKVAYPELARQIEMGYSNDVSMGTQVAFSLCSACGNKAVTEADYCDHVRSSKGLSAAGSTEDVYEINNGLNFIEISVVSNGADPKAKIKTVLAQLKSAVEKREQLAESCVSPIEANRLRDEIKDIQAKIANLDASKVASCGQSGDCGGVCNCDGGHDFETNNDELGNEVLARRRQRHKLAQDLGLNITDPQMDQQAYTFNEEALAMTKQNKKDAYFMGGGGLNDPSSLPYEKEDYQSIRDNEDKQMVGQGMEPGSEGMHPGYQSYGTDEALKQQLHRAELEKRRQQRHALLNQTKEAYFMGGGGLNDPAALPYEKEDYQSIRDNEDKQMVGQGMEPGSEGMHPGYQSYGTDEALKQQLHRAKLRARFKKASKREDSTWTLLAGTEPLLSVTAQQLYSGDLDKPNADNPEMSNWDWVNSEEYGRNLIRAVKTMGFDAVKAELEKAAQELDLGDDLAMDAPMMDEAPVEEMGGEEELSTREQIQAALDTIEEASREIRSLNDSDDADVDSLETEMDLGDAGAELEQLEQTMAASNSDQLEKLSVVAKEALSDANKILRKAKAIVTAKTASPFSPVIEKVAEKDVDQEEVKEEIDNAEEHLDEAEEELSVDSKDDEKDDEKMAEAKLAARKAARRKLASELYNLTDGDMIAEAHPDGGTDTKAAGSDQELEGDAHVETVTEQQEINMEVAERQPRGELTAREQRRRELVAQLEEKKAGEKPDFLDLDEDGDKEESMADAAEDKEEKDEHKEARSARRRQLLASMDEDDDEDEEEEEKMEDKAMSSCSSDNSETLEATAEVDAETKSYWKEMMSSSATGTAADSESQQFANELTQDYAVSKTTASAEDLKFRMKRAYRIAAKQAQLKQIDNNEEAIEAQVDRLIEMDSESFDAFANVIDNTQVVKEAHVDKLAKTAGALQVGRTDPGIRPDYNELAQDLSKFDWK